MFRKFIWLEWKAFFRSSAFASNMVIKVFMVLGALYFMACCLFLGIAVHFMIKDAGRDSLTEISRYMIYYVLIDLTMRIMLQKIPVINIRPLLALPIKRGTVVNFAMGKMFLSFFNLLPACFFIPYCVVLMVKGYDPLHVAFWLLSIWAIGYSNNLLNMLLNDKDNLYALFIVLLLSFAGLQYYHVFDVTIASGAFFHGIYTTGYLLILPLAVLAALWYVTYKFFIKTMYLDTGLKGKHTEAKTENFTWLNRFGLMGTFLKNDIKLIKRNKRSRNAVLGGVIFLFYGLLFMTGAIEQYDRPYWKMFGGIFVTGGFMFTFGQLVPSWDSAYYPLMMSQNIKYREYISAKWWLVVIGTAITTVLASFYLLFGVQTYLLIVAGAVYNIGVNSHLVLLGGAFIKTPIDLASSKQAFGDKKAFNVQGLLLTLPKLVLPILLYILGNNFFGEGAGIALVAGAGVLGFAFRNMVFKTIERIYISEKYKTIDAYKQKN